MGIQKLNFDEIKESCLQLTSLASSFSDTIDATTAAVGQIVTPTWDGKAAKSYKEKLKTLLNHLPSAKQQLALSVLFLTSCANAYDDLGQESVKKLKDLVGGQEYIDSYDLSKAPDVDLNSRYNVDASQQTNADTEPKSNGIEAPNSDGSSGGRRNGSSSGSSGSNGSSSYGSISTGASMLGINPSDDSTSGTQSTITGLVTTDNTNKEITIPSDVKQGGYTVTGYDYWINSGREMTWAAGTNQRKVSDIWKEQGSVFKNGIAVINVDGQDRYLVAVSTKFGQAGDCIDVKLADGTVLPCIIGDSKGSDATSEWGHVLSDGKINVLEFEVQREKYMSSGNPTTETWGLPWDSNQAVTSITNKGSIIGAQLTTKESTNTNAASTSTTDSNAVG